MSGKGKDKAKDKDRDSRPFKCPVPDCKWTFARQEHVTRHLRTHSGERPFLCTYDKCPSRFARNDELRRHIRLVHEYDRDTSHEAALADGDKVVYNGHNRRQSEQVTSNPATVSSFSSAERSGYAGASSIHASSSRTQHPQRPATSMSYYPQSTAYAMPPPPVPSSSHRTVAQPNTPYEDFIPNYSSSSQQMRQQMQPYQTQPSSMYPQSTYPQSTYPQSTYPQSTYPQSTYPQSTYSQSMHTQSTYSQSMYPQSTYSSSTYSSSMQAPPMQQMPAPQQSQPPPMQYQYQYPSAAAASHSYNPVHLPPLQQSDGYMTDSGTRERARARERERERRVQLPGFSELVRHPNEDPNEDPDPMHRRYH